ncbi:FAD-binding oxidoreductase [Gammaproteobacteria bacterium]|nr:FAD-binding oxidoreductase [Gammaproteobacteria bacterium]
MTDKILTLPNSLWNATAEPFTAVDCLKGNIETDLVIVGAGYTGLSTALHSIDSIKDIVIIDQMQPGWGCSGRNGGQINPQWKPPLSTLQQLFPGDTFNAFIDTVNQSAQLVFDMIERYQISCEVHRNGSIIPGKGRKAIRYLTEWSHFWQDYGVEVELLDAKETALLIGTSSYDLCMLDPRGGSLQPLSYSRGLARACQQHGIKIFGDTKANNIASEGGGWLISTYHGRIKCKRLVLATNGYTDGLWPGLARTIIPVISMLTATRSLPAELVDRIIPGRQPVAEYAGVPAYYRIDESNRLVFGWRGTVYGGMGSLDTAHLKSRAIRLFPQIASVEWEFDWAGYVGITSHQRPLLLELGDNAFAGLGYNGRGITMATMMGRQLALALTHQPTGIPIGPLETVPFHPFYPLGVSARIVSGHVRDYLNR